MHLFFLSFLETSIRGGVLIGTFLLLRPLLRRMSGGEWTAFLWIPVMARLLIPLPVLFPWEARLPFLNIQEPAAGAGNLVAFFRVSPAITNLVPEDLGTVPMETAGHTETDIPIYLFLWITGMILCLLMGLLRLKNLRAYASRTRPVEDAQILTVYHSLPKSLRGSVEVRMSPDVRVPCLAGIRNPDIWLPETGLDRVSGEDLYCIFLHELGHVQRRDPLMTAGIRALSVVHWFNPLVWIAAKTWAADRELACDAWALRRLKPNQTNTYGRILMKFMVDLSNTAPSSHHPRCLPGMASSMRICRKRIREISKGAATDVSVWRNAVAVVPVAALMILISIPYRGMTGEPKSEGQPVTDSTSQTDAADGTKAAGGLKVESILLTMSRVEFDTVQKQFLETFPENKTPGRLTPKQFQALKKHLIDPRIAALVDPQVVAKPDAETEGSSAPDLKNGSDTKNTTEKDIPLAHAQNAGVSFAMESSKEKDAVSIDLTTEAISYSTQQKPMPQLPVKFGEAWVADSQGMRSFNIGAEDTALLIQVKEQKEEVVVLILSFTSEKAKAEG